MAELTLPVILQIIQTIGLLVGIFYYIMVLRNQQRTQELAQETRLTQLTSDITEKLGSKDFLRDFNELSQLEWEDVDDFRQKYDHTVNTESYAQRWTIWMAFENLGYLLREGLIDMEILFNVAVTGAILI